MPPLMPFPAINNIWISGKRSNFTSVFSKAACQANPGAVTNEHGRVHIFQDIYFESSQMYQLIVCF